MRITRVGSVPMRSPPWVLVRVFTDADLIGLGEAYHGTGVHRIAVDPRLTGALLGRRDPRHVERLARGMGAGMSAEAEHGPAGHPQPGAGGRRGPPRLLSPQPAGHGAALPGPAALAPACGRSSARRRWRASGRPTRWPDRSRSRSAVTISTYEPPAAANRECAAFAPILRRKCHSPEACLGTLATMTDPASRLVLLLAEGEGQRLEFKQALSRLDREIVAFANSAGGTVLLGVDDAGEVVGVDTSNRTRSEIQAIARNCDPSVQIEVANPGADVLEVVVPDGAQKPYRCKDGFYLRQGATSARSPSPPGTSAPRTSWTPARSAAVASVGPPEPTLSVRRRTHAHHGGRGGEIPGRQRGYGAARTPSATGCRARGARRCRQSGLLPARRTPLRVTVPSRLCRLRLTV